MTAHPTADPTVTIIIVAARAWRSAHNRGAPIQPALFAALDRYRCGVLVPAVDSVMTLYEAYTGRFFRVGGQGPALLSDDESRLIWLLAAPTSAVVPRFDRAVRPGLAATLRVAVQSTRILMRRALAVPLAA